MSALERQARTEDAIRQAIRTTRTPEASRAIVVGEREWISDAYVLPRDRLVAHLRRQAVTAPEPQATALREMAREIEGTTDTPVLTVTIEGRATLTALCAAALDRSLRRGRMSDAARSRDDVLEALATPRTVAWLRHDMAARYEAVGAIDHAVAWHRIHKLIEPCGLDGRAYIFRRTAAGDVEAARLAPKAA